ncbi:MAG: restriction endonuclease, partial [Candidatus Competibacteraceae bacterium]|nr:restriction endonuclease [Candidatus Competibacteraceae bacterium]
MGNATDIWTAYREGRLGKLEGFRPLLGYFFLLEECERVHKPVGNVEPHFQVDPVFKGATYAERYGILCRRLVQERLYDVACLTLATNQIPTKFT